MKVLVTGHMGFVGKYFIKALRGHDITGVDIQRGNDVREFFRTNTTQYDLVIHLAAVVGGRALIDGNPIIVATDLSIDAEMFNWALRTQQKKIVYYSSSAAYPISQQTFLRSPDLREDMISFQSIDLPDMSYGWAKLSGEYLASFLIKHGVEVYIFRPFSGYGSDQSTDYPFGAFIERAIKKEDPFDVWGTGKQLRDFIHIEDVVRGTLTIIDQAPPDVYNLGTGIGTSFLQLADMVCKEVGYQPEIRTNPDKPVGVMKRVANISKMSNYYIPKISLQEGIRRAINETTYEI